MAALASLDTRLLRYLILLRKFPDLHDIEELHVFVAGRMPRVYSRIPICDARIHQAG
ncbi:hypothetical protein Pan153_52740 [Gimesia panareensis]|uniref:Uncharacterized protein n=1 Tax=Gimesia panareensis TaxID=2527978 RepID=A0A518FW70_9PLAN|nr:hypothetical protein Pan153_52740 [Gimesia panareensis]